MPVNPGYSSSRGAGGPNSQYTPLLSSQSYTSEKSYTYSTYTQSYGYPSHDDSKSEQGSSYGSYRSSVSSNYNKSGYDGWPVRRRVRKQQPPINCLRVLFAWLSFVFCTFGLMSFYGVGPWTETKGVTRRVAIIGAGASGVSAAYHLAKYGLDGSDTLEITVFEKSPSVGGRCLVLDVPKAGGMRSSSAFKVDIGASGYNSALDHLVSSLVEELGLKNQVVPGGRWAPVTADWELGIYNGQNLLFRQPYNAQGIWRWWTSLGYFIRYGWAHNNLESITKRLIPMWNSYSQALSFPMSWMQTGSNQGLQTSDLKTAMMTPATSFFNSRNVKHPFTTEQIQSRARAVYGANLGVLSGMQAMRIMEEAKNEVDANVVLEGGMAGLFDKMLRTTKHARNAKINVKVGTVVGGVRKNETEDGEMLGWTVAHWSSDDDSQVEPKVTMAMEDFDEVVIAGPWHLTGLLMQPQYPPQEISWEKVHVTVFTSTNKLAPGSFGLGREDFKGMPQRILSTLNDEENNLLNEKSGEEGVGNTGWWSIEHIGVIPRIIASSAPTELEPCEDPNLCAQSVRMENVFKILSPTEISNETILRMLDGKAEVLTWVHRHFWEHAYATPLPEELNDEDISKSVIVDDGLWYTAGIEGVWGGVEAAMTMGKRVATEILDKWSPRVPKKGTVRRGERW